MVHVKIMRIDFNLVIKDLGNKPIKENIGGKIQDADLKFYSVFSLTGNPKDPTKQINGVEKLKRFELAQKINKGGEIEVTVEEITLIKQLIGEYLPIIIVGRCYELLDPKEKVESETSTKQKP